MTNTTLDLVPLIRGGSARPCVKNWFAGARAAGGSHRQLTAGRPGHRISHLPRRLAAAVFEYMPPAKQRALVKAMARRSRGPAQRHGA
jgi:hypothetical protein